MDILNKLQAYPKYAYLCPQHANSKANAIFSHPVQ